MSSDLIKLFLKLLVEKFYLCLLKCKYKGQVNLRNYLHLNKKRKNNISLQENVLIVTKILVTINPNIRYYNLLRQKK